MYRQRRSEVDEEMKHANIAKCPQGGVGNELWLVHGTSATNPKVTPVVFLELFDCGCGEHSLTTVGGVPHSNAKLTEVL